MPTLARTRDLITSAELATPVLFVAFSTFVANDLDDRERDAINHPCRPIPAKHISPTGAALIFFSCLALALFTTKHFVDRPEAFLYYLTLIGGITYSYIKDYLPSIKAVYVSLIAVLPIAIVAALSLEPKLYLVAAALLLFILGREICMDMIDQKGDAPSWIHRARPSMVVTLAFGLQGTGVLILTILTNHLSDFLGLVGIAACEAVVAVLWFHYRRLELAVAFMKVPLLMGLVFLI